MIIVYRCKCSLDDQESRKKDVTYSKSPALTRVAFSSYSVYYCLLHQLLRVLLLVRRGAPKIFSYVVAMSKLQHARLNYNSTPLTSFYSLDAHHYRQFLRLFTAPDASLLRFVTHSHHVIYIRRVYLCY